MTTQQTPGADLVIKVEPDVLIAFDGTAYTLRQLRDAVRLQRVVEESKHVDPALKGALQRAGWLTSL